MMISPSDKDWIKANSAEVIEGTGEAITRRRLDTAEKPESFDSDFGEVVKPDEEEYEEVSFTGKVFWNPKEEHVAGLFGGATEGAAIVHAPIDVDVKTGDTLLIAGAGGSIEFRVGPVRPAALGGFLEVGITRK